MLKITQKTFNQLKLFFWITCGGVGIALAGTIMTAVTMKQEAAQNAKDPSQIPVPATMNP